MPDFAGLFTPSGAIAFLAGIVARRMWCIAKNKYLDRVDPAGAPHRDSVKVIILAWGITLMAILYIGVQTQATYTTTVKLTRDVARCWQESYQSTKAQIEINRQNDLITRKQQDLQRDYDRDTADWLKALVNPPGELADESTNSPRRQRYGLEITAQYQTKLDDLGARFDRLVNQRTQLDKERAEHPLPETTCGK